MIDFLQKGGPIMWLLVFCSIFVTGIFIDRWLSFHRASFDVGKFLKGLAVLIRSGRLDEAAHECSLQQTPATRVMYAMLARHDAPREELRHIAQEAGQLELPYLERRLAALSTTAILSPLIGLLGTVVGMLQVFVGMSTETGYVTAAEMAAGIYQSMLTTAAGLAVAIAAYAGYGYLSAWLTTLMHEMERAGIEVLHLLAEKPDTPKL